MKLSRAISNIKRGLGYRLAGDAGIIEAIEDAQEQMETTWTLQPIPWFLLSERSVATSPGEEERLLLPSDFIMEVEQDALWLQLEDGGEVALKKYDADDLRTMSQNYSATDLIDIERRGCFSYALTGDYFRIFPRPSAARTYKMMYYQRQPVVTDPDSTNRWLTYAPWVLIGSAGEELAMGLRDGAAKQHFQQKKSAGIEALTVFTTERELANRRMAMGETL